ncbi:hypothetical protein ACFV9C_42975 [Kribbella sp. NPDC059898]|uniref:hypothetical protein n=1 Tax=Kribbella sp. NPDC059898 TaxID=3346995 RepID=UPI00366461D1
MITATANSAHVLTFDVPTTRDYLNGGFGDLVAQCSCGAYDYVLSTTEGAYWHSLHLAQPNRHPLYLTLDAPMPEGWTEPLAAWHKHLYRLERQYSAHGRVNFQEARCECGSVGTFSSRA